MHATVETTKDEHHRASVSQQIPAMASRVGPGWHALTLRLHEELLRRDAHYRVLEYGERRGGLYVRVCSPAQLDLTLLTMTARRSSLLVCALCGEPGQLRVVKSRSESRLMTRCPLCAGQRNASPGTLAWKLVDEHDVPLPAGNRGGYQVIVGDRENGLRTFARILRLSGRSLVHLDDDRTVLHVDHKGHRETWLVIPVLEGHRQAA